MAREWGHRFVESVEWQLVWVAGCGSPGQAVTVTDRESHPEEPSGITPWTWSVCTVPVPSVARHRMVCRPASVASHGWDHCRQVSVLTCPERVASCHWPSSICTWTPVMPRCWAQAMPATATVPVGIWAKLLGTSIRDAVLIGACGDQPRLDQ